MLGGSWTQGCLRHSWTESSGGGKSGRSAAASEDLAHGRRVEVLEDTLHLSPRDMDDEADGCSDEIAGLELSMEDVTLNEPTTEKLPREHLVPTLEDSPGEVLQERQILFACLRFVRDVVPDLRLRRIELANRIEVASLDRREERGRDHVGFVGHG